MGRVLYREYRPLTFDDVKGQDHIVSALKIALKRGAVAHAYLFTGSHGTGKTSVARILAHEINNLAYTGEETHLDIIEIDAASNRRIDEIRDLRDKAHIAPTSAKYKVYIIDEVHMLTREAFNALLKTLEEPPEHAIFILATTEAHKVPHTIISRTQRFSFKPQDDSTITARLKDIAMKEKIAIDNDALSLIARNSNKSFRDAISLLDQIQHGVTDSKTPITESLVASIIGAPPYELIEDIVQSLITQNASLLFKTTEILREQGINATVVASELLHALRSHLLQGEGNNAGIVMAMKMLLENMNSATYEIIEVAILEQIKTISLEQKKETPAPQSKIPEVSEEEQKTRDKPAPKKPQEENPLEDKTNEQPEERTTLVEDLVADRKDNSSFTWNDVLKEIKGHHNTLYGILKMSDVKLEDSSIHVVFKFSFHEKQFKQSKHTTTLKNVLRGISGVDYEVKTSVNTDMPPKVQEQATKEEKNHPDDTISNISNIFSGAELLE